jgi:hypothetical protein
MTEFKPKKATGSHFYKYKSADNLERLKPLILDHLLYIPSVAQLNDPADCRPKLAPLTDEEMVAFMFRGYIQSHPTIPLDELARQEPIIRYNVQKHGLEWCMRESSALLNAQLESFRVYSLSKRFDNLSIWAKYAADHTGYCLEFENKGPLFTEHVFEVIYGQSAPFSLIDSEKRDARFLVYKKPDWSNEEEVRLIRARGSGPEVTIEPHWLTRIILGERMSPENQKQIRGWAESRQPKLIVVQAFFDTFHHEIRLRD